MQKGFKFLMPVKSKTSQFEITVESLARSLTLEIAVGHIFTPCEPKNGIFSIVLKIINSPVLQKLIV